MKLFIKNTNIDGVMELNDYMYLSFKSNDAFIISDDLKINYLDKFGSVIKNPKYIGASTSEKTIIPLKVIENSKEGLTLEVFNEELKLAQDFHFLLGDDILSIKNPDRSRTLLNLETMETIFTIPGECLYATRLIGNGNTVAVATKSEGERFEKILFIKDGKLVSIVSNISVVYLCNCGSEFMAIKKAYEDEKYLVALDRNTNNFVQYESCDSLILPYNSRKCNTIMAIKGNSLYKIEDIHKGAALVKTFENLNVNICDIQTDMNCCQSNVIFLKDTEASPLISFDGTIIDTDVSKVRNASYAMLLPFECDSIIYKKKDQSHWFYNLSTKLKVDITNIVKDNTFDIRDFAFTEVDYHIDAILNSTDSHLLEDFDVLELKPEAFDAFLEECNDILVENKLILQQHGSRITFHLIKDDSTTPLFTKDGEVQFFDCFTIQPDDEGNLILFMLRVNDKNVVCIDEQVGHIKISELIEHATSVEALMLNDISTKLDFDIKALTSQMKKILETEKSLVDDLLC